MNILYFDCFAGVSGDMILGALIDSGLDFDLLKNELEKLALPGYSLSAEKAVKKGITGTAFRVKVSNCGHARHYRDIITMINSSELDPEVKHNACSIFTLLGHAESRVHGTDIDSVHFHEVGAVDSIIDICGAAIGLKAAGVARVYCSAVNTGSGTVKTEHGTLPVPAPATTLLLEGMTAYSTGTMAELATPTGTAILKHYCGKSSSMPAMNINTSGYGAGSRDLEFPNMLRVFRGCINNEAAAGEQIIELETNIDDMNPEIFSRLFDSLYAIGALDVAVIPAFMKKNRPGHILKILTSGENREPLMAEIFRETTSSGIRFRQVQRVVLERNIIEVNTEFGMVRVKVHKYEGETVTVSPEYEDCLRQAVKNNVAVKTVFNAAIACSYRGF
ncbi:MAG TPA: nickel pincer cofactor biosynthesis protein LarC [Spirochaetota bacterium]|nr:nickel pincer cofactor biosynthesis protein LarC [Spirochaetota bacterium]HQO39288.1 nickel pincer cofactor biosynthesis protein LarC [Spirochaetota bacterium]